MDGGVSPLYLKMMMYLRVKTMGSTCGVGSAYPSRVHEITPSFWWGSCCLVFYVMACELLFVCLSFSFLAMMLSVYFQSMSLNFPLVSFPPLFLSQYYVYITEINNFFEISDSYRKTQAHMNSQSSPISCSNRYLSYEQIRT